MPVMLAVVLLGADSPVDAGALKREIETTWPDFPSIDEPEAKDRSIAFKFGQANIAFTYVPAPLPHQDLESACAASLLWPNVTAEAGAHQAHWVVVALGELEPLDLSTRLHQITAALLSASADAIGVYWQNADLLVPKHIFQEFTQRVLPMGPPVQLWVDSRVGNEAGGVSGFTIGMEPLGHRELEVKHSPESVAETRERLLNIVGYLLENGPVIGDGDTIGNNADEKILVRYEPSQFGRESEIMRICFEGSPPEPATPRWKFWQRKNLG